MNPALTNLLNILSIAAGAVADTASGKVSDAGEIAEYILRIANASIAAYEAQTGKPIDPTLLKPEAPIA